MVNTVVYRTYIYMYRHTDHLYIYLKVAPACDVPPPLPHSPPPPPQRTYIKETAHSALNL